jgi:hypothetical protein
VNGTDTPIKYDGTTVTTTAFTYAGAPPPAFDADQLSLDHAAQAPAAHGGEEQPAVWFPTVDAISGACGLLDLGPVFTKGGTWRPSAPPA